MGSGSSKSESTSREDNVPLDDVIVPPSDPDPSDLDTLQVTEVDFEIEYNVKDHHTDDYDVAEEEEEEASRRKLVVRRGQPFTMRITFNRHYQRTVDDMRMVFETGNKPNRKRGTHVQFKLSAKDCPGQWGASIVTHHSDLSIRVKVFVPPECIVGMWSFQVHVITRKEGKVTLTRYTHCDKFYLLFNPWCREDTVYMDSQAEREEYVLSEKGRIWVGSAYRLDSKPWFFGQFSGQVLDCCMYLLDQCRLRDKERGNPVKVVRQLTAVVNAPDDGGVLSGNWSGNYSGGTSPLTWTGSKAILEQFYKDKKPVKFGQCWVFSGVLTAVCRALGIPARSVTNFSSAHDVDGSITIDKVLDDEGDEVRGENGDSVWNFHVWNDVWMARPELPPGYGGWQACDATPQERSEGLYMCGPCPLRAIKEGGVNLGYDGPFIFAEVNADRITWLKKDGAYTKVRLDKNAVGKKMSTKTVGHNYRQDVTSQYKHQDRSTGERVAVRRAQKCSSSYLDAYLEEDPPKDVDFELSYDGDNTLVGDDFILKVPGKNKKSERRTVKGHVVVRVMSYTGVPGDKVTKTDFEKSLAPNESDTLEVEVRERDYRDKLLEGCFLSFTVMATVTETGQIFTKTEQTCLKKPHLKVTGPGSAQKGEEFEVEVSMTNPLSCTLTGCYLEMEAHGVKADFGAKKNVSDVGPKETFTDTLKLKGTKKGEREVVLVFNSQQLEDINSTHDVRVTI